MSSSAKFAAIGSDGRSFAGLDFDIERAGDIDPLNSPTAKSRSPSGAFGEMCTAAMETITDKILNASERGIADSSY